MFIKYASLWNFSRTFLSINSCFFSYITLTQHLYSVQAKVITFSTENHAFLLCQCHTNHYYKGKWQMKVINSCRGKPLIMSYWVDLSS